MAKLRDTRDCLLLSFDQNIIDDEEFILLYGMNSSKNPDFPYWRYEPFDLDCLSDEECKAEFRFWKNDIYLLKEVMQLPDEIICYNRLVVSGVEALCILLKRFAYPIRYSDMCPRFARPIPQLSMITSEVMNLVYNHHSYRLTSLQQDWLSPASLQNYADAIHNAGHPTPTAGALLMEQSGQFVNLGLYKGFYIMGTKECMQ